MPGSARDFSPNPEITLKPMLLSDLSVLSHSETGDKIIHGNAQDILWLDSWCRNVNSDVFIAGLFDQDQPILLLPLEVLKSGGFRIARFPGGTHANGNFPWVIKDKASRIDITSLQSLVKHIHRERPDIHALTLTRQLPQIADIDNPLLKLHHRKNPNPILSASLDKGFESVLARSNAKRKTKKHRSHMRRYDEAGGWRIFSPQGESDTLRVLDAFFSLKAERFAQMGISDPFAGEDIHAFFNDLFTSSHSEPRSFELKVLEVNGKIHALIGKSLSADGPTVEFSAIANDELTSASPGEYLFYEDILNSCADGYQMYSFGIGDEPYKREWCDIEQAVYDTIIPLNARGKVFRLTDDLRTNLIGAIKGNERVWSLAKTIRRKLVR